MGTVMLFFLPEDDGDFDLHEDIRIANEAVGKLRARLIEKITLSVIPDQLVRSSAQAFFQGHVRRSLMLIEGGYEAYRANRGLVAVLCARGVFETVACVLDFCDKLTDELDNKDTKGRCILSKGDCIPLE